MKTRLTPLLLSLILGTAHAQQKVPVIRTKLNNITMYLDQEKDDFNGINFIPGSFTYSFVRENPTSSFILVSEKDSVSMQLQHGVNTRFYILREAKGDTVVCNFSSHKYVKPALFTDAYKQENRGKTRIEAPEVYELFNVILALTEYGKTGAIEKETPYYNAVMQHFSTYKNQPAVKAVDSLLKATADFYPLLKMDSYAYAFEGDKIKKAGIYDRVSWGERNELEPYIGEMEAFAKATGFRSFYKKNSGYYKELITDFTKNIDVASMKTWLEKQFPRTRYDGVKIIFSPLVGYNQSANSFEDNGFREAQAHINFPFVSKKDKTQPPAVLQGKRMLIAFTELNHSYLNPEADRYAQQIAQALKDLSRWTTAGKPAANYDNALSCFEEYMNYGLATLYFSDIFEPKTAGTLTANMENNMEQFRGFNQFGAFNQELLRLYKNKTANQTAADLYPEIIKWMAAH